MMEVGTFDQFVVAFFVFWSLYSTVQFFRYREERADLLTDMSQLIHDGKVEGDDLRRTRGMKEIEKRLDE